MEGFDYKLSQNYPSNTNSSVFEEDQDLARLRVFTFVNCVINACCSLTASAGNGIILFVILKTPALHTPSNALLFGLALTDFFVGVLTQPLQVICSIYLISDRNSPYPLIDAFDVLSVILSAASFITATVISLDRYLVFYLHMRYPTIVTNKKIVAIIALAWFLSSLMGFIWTQSTTTYYFVAIASFIISFSVIILMYSNIYRIVKRHQTQIQAQAQVNTEKKASMQLHFARCTKSAMNTFCVCFFLFLCYFPYICTAGFIQLTSFSVNKYIALQFTGTVTFVNSSLNPLVYFWRVVDIRTAIKSTFNCHRSREMTRMRNESNMSNERTSRM